jgi:hypothetical protein
MPESNHGTVPMKFAVAVPFTLPNRHLLANIFPGRGWWGVWKGVWCCRSWGGWICLAVGTVSERIPSLLEVKITHTHTNVRYTSLVYVPTYERMFHSTPHHRVELNKKRVCVHTFHSTPHHRVEWNKYWVAQQKWFHSTRVRTYVQTYVTLHTRMYLCTNVCFTPLHITEWSGTKKEYEFIQKARRWKKSSDAEKTRCWKYHQTLKKPDAEKLPDAEKASNLLPVARLR